MTIRAVATSVFVFIALAIITAFISANVRELARQRGWDTFLVRWWDALPEQWRGALRWGRLRGLWWLWSMLGLSGGVALTLWLAPLLVGEPAGDRASPPAAAVPPLPSPKATNDEASAIAQLTEVGWSVKRGINNTIIFEISAPSPLPDMKVSASFFKRIKRSFSIVFQQLTNISDLHYLSDVANLPELSISAGSFSDLSELKNFTNLVTLNITQEPFNNFETVDLSPLAGLVNLRTLIIFGTRATTAVPLANLSNLKTLSLKGTLVTGLTPLAKLHSLETLNISETRITDLRPLAEDKYLKQLSVGSGQIPGLSALTTLQNLQKLTVFDQTNVNLAPIAELQYLEELTIWGSHVFDLSFLNLLEHLRDCCSSRRLSSTAL